MTGNKTSGIVLQPRDYQFLSAVGQLRLVDREMSQVIFKLPGTRNTNKRLLELTRAGLLIRFFIGTVASGRKAIYTLSPKSAALVDAEFRGVKRKPEENLVGDLFVQHQLAVNTICLILRFQAIPIAGIRLLRWLTFYEAPVPSASVIPDGYVELQTQTGIRAMFLEVDRGTEALRIWQKKISEYLKIAVSGEFAKLFGQSQFRVLIVTTSERRMNNIRALIAKSTDKVFWLSTLSTIQRVGFWSPIWLRPTGDQHHSLL